MVGIATAARVVGGVVLLLANGYFVGIEFAMTRVRQFSESEFQGSSGLRRAWDMTDRLEIFLSGCQVGITICSVGLGVVAEPAVAALFGAGFQAVGLTQGAGHTTASVVAALAVINLLHVIIGEQAPTYFGVERTKTAAKYGAPVLYWWTKVMSPVIRLADWTAKAILGLFGVTISRSWTEAEEGEEGFQPSNRAEARRQFGDALRGIDVSDERREEVLNAFDIGDKPVEEVMVDESDIVGLSLSDPLEENLERVRSTPHVRYPLFGDGTDHTDYRGIVYTPTLFARIDELEDGDLTLEDVAAPPMTVTADTPVSDVIDQFQAENQELALVLSGGEVVGMVTTTDAFEAIAGELEDPIDLGAQP